MNILVVGNGFDLSHFLPTKYDHFMFAMQSIQNFKKNNIDMEFKNIFGELLESEYKFFDKTKTLYDTNKIIIPQNEVKSIKDKLNKNSWYKYFHNHFTEIKTWIDFEQKIEEALVLIAKAIEKIEEKYNTFGIFNYPVYTKYSERINQYYFSEIQFHLLSCLNLIEEEVTSNSPGYRYGFISSSFYTVLNDEKYGFNSQKYLQHLQDQLDDFIDLFNLYLCLVVDKLLPFKKFSFNKSDCIDEVFSFNYTTTFENFYESPAAIHFLHGKLGKQHNLVLGISELKDVYLKSLKAYGFTKYHQKIYKNTNYQFLNSKLNDLKVLNEALSESKLDYRAGVPLPSNIPSYNTLINRIKNSIENFDLNIQIWGHSLDISDEVYINEIFSFNEISDNKVRVCIYYFDPKAKFALLNNLFHILGKEKVETWMKNGWLHFDENPNLVKND
ncbi:hypothetical protein IIQ44_03645 [Acinetobacter oleivorans]|uniref:Bacteriophage abortive infection AbiH n=1 Tax=Acinetobacter oleivorans TaxID=1148157 RepID=A0ABR9NLI5_9GAMM|nr:AbiH family protein [Acinetobacter oleivorans]MBE2165405.1 hypothetical protein [Acinetobacter oleivorans]MBE2170999.1 hypothetical protein [Acinetobacter oleivorans]